MFGFRRQGGPRVERIAPRDAVARVVAGQAVLIDVREPDEIARTGIAEGAIAVPLGQIGRRCDPARADRPAGLSPETPVILYCAAGGRAQRAGEALIALGYVDVSNLGGLSDWIAGGGKVRR